MLVFAAALGLAFVPTSSFDYPPEALERGEQGVSVIAFQVDAKGHPFACRLVRSSGNASLDRASCPIVLKPTVVLPAPVGAATPYAMTKRIRWQIAEDIPEGEAATRTVKDGDPARLAGWLLIGLCGSYLVYGTTRSRRGPDLARSRLAGQVAVAARPLAREAQVLAAMLIAVLATIAALIG